MRRIVLLLLLIACRAARAQFEIEESHTTASLRGIHSLGAGVAWASGSDGTILRTEDGGYLWQVCATPPGGDKLDFRAIQGFDANSAVVMSSGKGELSKVFKTTDGCQSWKLVVTNPDKDGFWDALNAVDRNNMILLGDPVDGHFKVLETWDGGVTWTPRQTQPALPGEGAFAASNSSLAVEWVEDVAMFGTGSPSGARLFSQCVTCPDWDRWTARAMPMFGKGASAGIFSIGLSDRLHLVAVGGDYTKPNDTSGAAACTLDGGQHWIAASKPPHGYRSAVAYDAAAKTWITAGPNGTDISKDGSIWTPLAPGPLDAAGSDRGWNALSLPFVVGSKGRIGKLRGDALKPAKPGA
jgi:photosystem II stability/assembly factor-like uncharacterized protein